MKACEIELKDCDIEKLSQQLRKKVMYSIDLLRKSEKLANVYDKENGFYLSFSGGKDSQCLYHVAKLAGVKFKAHMSFTSVDPAEVVRFVRSEYPDVEIIKPKKSIFQVAVDKSMMPSMNARWCCAVYKELHGGGRVKLIGIRKSESFKRSKRNEVEIDSRKYSGNLDGLEEYRNGIPEKKRKKNAEKLGIEMKDSESFVGCINGKESIIVSPIFNWSESDVWEFLNTMRIPHCQLYDEGFRRIGCINCPMSSRHQKEIENERWPHVKRNWIKAIIKIMGSKQSKKGIWSFVYDIGSTDYERAELLYDWWISGKQYKQWYSERFLQEKIFFGDGA